MLRVSKLADYATLVMVCLAQRHDELLNAKVIANETHLQLPTVSKLLKLMAVAKLLISVRGVKGGYRLARAPEEINLAEIIEVVEEHSGLTECSEADGHCAVQDLCTVRDNWRLVSNVIQQAFSSISLADFAKPQMPAMNFQIGESDAASRH